MAKRKGKSEIAANFGAEVLEAVEHLIAKWPKHRQDGSRIVNSPVMLADRLLDLTETIDLALLLEAGHLYINSRPDWPRCVQFFYGLKPEPQTGKPPYVPWVRAAMWNRRAGE